MEGGVMAGVSVSDIPALTEREADCHESGFRSGYWDGVLAACNEIIMGATQHDVRLWLFREVKEWALRGRENPGYEEPPPCPRGRSFEESTIHIKSERPVARPDRCFVYAIGDGHGHTKIGIANDIQSRIRSLQTGNAARLYLICYIAVESREAAERAESWCHNELRDERLCGEWFSVYDDNAWQTLFECVESIGVDSCVVEVESRVY
jgi:hypothetical protein